MSISALISLSLLGASLAPAFAQKPPTPAPAKMGSGKMGSAKMGSKKKTPERGADGRFKKKATPAPATGKMGSGKMGSAKAGSPAGKPVWDAKLKRWRLNGKFITEAEALKLGGKK